MVHLLSPIEAIVGLVTFSFLFYFIWTKKQSKILNPLAPNIPGGWPVIGHLFYFKNNGDDDRHFSQKLGDLADKYGPVFTFRLGFRRFLAVSSYEAMKECFTTNDIHFADRPALLYGEYLCYNNAMLAVAKYGPYLIQNLLRNNVTTQHGTPQGPRRSNREKGPPKYLDHYVVPDPKRINLCQTVREDDKGQPCTQ